LAASPPLEARAVGNPCSLSYDFAIRLTADVAPAAVG
jgi:hypothetical protein